MGGGGVQIAIRWFLNKLKQTFYFRTEYHLKVRILKKKILFMLKTLILLVWSVSVVFAVIDFTVTV